MDTTDPSTSLLEQLDRQECLALLGDSAFVGRIAFINDRRPAILPVNYVLDAESVVFHTAEGSVLSGLDGDQVAFEVDDSRPLDRSGWSVVVQGTAHQITDPGELDALRRGPLHSWARRAADHWFRISIDTVSGRRVGRS